MPSSSTRRFGGWFCTWCVLAAGASACSPDSTQQARGNGSPACASAECGAAGGASAAADSGTSSDFGNAPPITDAGTVDFDALQKERDPNKACDPGTYKGTYKCTLEMNGMMSLQLEGNVSFDLAIDETTQMNDCPPGTEFCQDLVIAKGSGKLLGFALLIIGFETSLEGGLDCKTGEFQAKAIDGIWGLPVSSNPSDPNAPLTVSKPPSGMFDGELNGVHLGGTPQRIEGMWSLREIAMNLVCPGPFTVERQP
jgi:hypothetical protein